MRSIPQRRINKISIQLLLSGILSCTLHAAAESILPVDGVVVSGQATIGTPSNNTLTINQVTDRAIVNWQGFSVGALNTVTFQQPGVNSAILNRVTGDAVSTIAGQISANGQVFLINPNGIAITPTGSVNVGGGFVASTLDITNQDFESANIRFNGTGHVTGVDNQGLISSGPAGFVALLGSHVLNTGVISVPFGKVAIGTGQQMALDFNGGGFLQVALPGQPIVGGGNRLVDVSGSIHAVGGRVEIKTATALDAIHDIVNISGHLVAKSISSKDGMIILDAGPGGQVKLNDGATLDTASANGKGGVISITGKQIAIADARLNADGATGGGSILIGGDYQGGGALMHATATSVGELAKISASATQDGDGGKVVLWSDSTTQFNGNVLARGADQGNGGMAEVSSHGVLAYDGKVDLRSDSGRTGDLLLDPYNVTISTGLDSNQAAFTATGNDSVINITSLQTALSGANVTVSTNTISNGAQAGDITLSNALSWSSGNSLTLNAFRDITINSGATVTAINGGSFNLNAGRNVAVNANIAGTNNALNLSVAAGALVNGSTAGLGTFALTGATINTQNGSLTVTATSSATQSIELTNAAINLGSGTGSITGLNTGSATNSNGIFLSGSNAFSAAGLTLTGSVTAGTRSGIFFGDGGSLTSTGNITLTGNTSGSAAGNASNFQGNYTATNTSGNLAITGRSSNNTTGLRFNSGSVTFNNNGAGTLAVLGESVGTGAGIRASAGTAIASNGNVSISGKSNTTFEGWRVDGNTSITQNTGTLALTGMSNTNRGLRVRGGTLTLNNNTAGTLVFNNSVASIAVQLDNNTGLASSGNVTLIGASSGNQAGVLFTGNNSIVNNGVGNLKIQGSSGGNNANAVGIIFNGGTNAITNNSNGNIELNGANTRATAFSDFADGIRVTGSSVINTTGQVSFIGNVLNGIGDGIFLDGARLNSGGFTTLSGTGTSQIGIEVLGGILSNLNGGSLAMSGTSTNAYGVYVSDDVSLLNANGNNFLVGGSSSNYIGMYVTDASDISITGNVNILASSASLSHDSAIFLEGNNSFINNGTGLLSVGAISTGFADGVYLDANAWNLSNNSSGSILVEARNTNSVVNQNVYSGIATNILGTSNAINTTGTVSLVGFVGQGEQAGISLYKTNLSSNGMTTIIGISAAGIARGVQFEAGNTVTLNGGSLDIAGVSVQDAGLQVRDAVTFNRNAGSLTLSGESTSYRGIDGFNGAEWAFNGNAAVNGDSVSGTGVRFENNLITVNSGEVAFNGMSTSNAGILVNGTVSTINNSTDVLHFIGTSDSANGLILDTNSALATTGNISLTGSSTSGTGLQINAGAALTQTSGNLDLSGNSITGLGLNTDSTSNITNSASGTLLLQSSRNMAIAGTIDSANGEVSLLSTGDLTLGATGSVAGKNPVLSATSTFINNRGSDAVIATSGRWLVYSANPATDIFGNLNSANNAIWNSSYANLPPASVNVAGNRYIFAYQPTLHISSTSLSKLYGTDATAAIANNYVITGIEPGIANAYLADIPSAIFSGAPSVSSLGAPANAGIGGGSFSVNVGTGSLLVDPAYGIAFHNNGLLTIRFNPPSVTQNLIADAGNASGIFNGTLRLADGGMSLSAMVKPHSIASEVLANRQQLEFTDPFYLNFNNSTKE